MREIMLKPTVKAIASAIHNPSRSCEFPKKLPGPGSPGNVLLCLENSTAPMVPLAARMSKRVITAVYRRVFFRGKRCGNATCRSLLGSWESVSDMFSNVGDTATSLAGVATLVSVGVSAMSSGVSGNAVCPGSARILLSVGLLEKSSASSTKGDSAA